MANQPVVNEHLLTALLTRPIALHPIFVQITGSLTAGVLLSQAYYWSQRTTLPDGWFYKTQAEWTDETYLSRKEIETARRKLRQCDFWNEDLRKADGAPTVHYKLDMDKLGQAILAFAQNSELHQSDNSNCTNREYRIAPIGQNINIDYKQRLQAETTKQQQQQPEKTNPSPKPKDADVDPAAVLEKEDKTNVTEQKRYAPYIAAYERFFGRPPANPFEAEQIYEWSIRVTLDGWTYALKEAAKAHATNFRYLEKVLVNVEKNGYTDRTHLDTEPAFANHEGILAFNMEDM
jgi:DnaD/phage-associated family protein